MNNLIIVGVLIFSLGGLIIICGIFYQAGLDNRTATIYRHSFYLGGGNTILEYNKKTDTLKIIR